MSMKTTVELPDELIARMHALAARRRTSIKRLFEAAVRQFLGDRPDAGDAPFRLEDRSVGGRGLVSELRGSSWDAIIGRAYEGRGG